MQGVVSLFLLIFLERSDALRGSVQDAIQIVFILAVLLLQCRVLMQQLVVLMPLFYQVISIRTKQSIDFLLDDEEILSAEKFLYHPLHQIDKCFEKHLVLEIGSLLLLLHALRVKLNDNGSVVITLD